MKSQIFSYDVLLTILVFVSIIALFNSVYNQVYSRIYDRESLNMAENVIQGTVDQLVEYLGYPVNWTTADVQILGLARADRDIDSGKVQNFISLANSSYNATREKLGLFAYNFKMSLSYLNGTVYASTASAPQGDNVFVMKRLCALDGSTEVIFTFTMW